MRKYIIGGLVGFLLAVPFTTVGAQVSTMLGKKVQNEFTVIIDGKRLEKKALAVDGSSYAPLRVIAEAIGYDIAFTNNTVIMSDPSMESAVPVTPNATTQGGATVATELTLEIQIEKTKSQIMKLSGQLFSFNTRYTPENVTEEAKQQIKDLEDEITRQQEHLKTLEAKLEAQATPTP